MPLQNTRQRHVLSQLSLLARCQLSDASIKYRVCALTGKARRVDNPVDIRVFGMDDLAEGAPGCMISCLDHVRRRPDARAAIRAKVEKGQRRARSRRYTHPRPFRDLSQRDPPCSSVRESIPHDCLDKRRGEVGRRIQHRIGPCPRREPGVGGACSQRRSDMPLRHDPVTFRERGPDKEGFDQSPRIAASGHVKVAPNPAAADRTSSSPPDRKRSRGRATPSSKGQS